MTLPHDEWGSGFPVVLIHAGVADRSMWSEVAPALAEGGYRVIAVDLPGYGDAPVSAGEQAPWNDVLVTLDGLRIGRCALVGSSYGAAVALRVAILAPDRVTALALISSPGADDAEPSAQLAAAWEEEAAAIERGDVESAVAAVVRAWTRPDAPARLRERVEAMQRRAYDRQLGAGVDEEAPDPAADWPAVLERLAMPVLVATGEHDMADFRSAADELEHWLPRADRVVFGRAGHLAPLEAPQAVAAAVAVFLRS